MIQGVGWILFRSSGVRNHASSHVFPYSRRVLLFFCVPFSLLLRSAWAGNLGIFGNGHFSSHSTLRPDLSAALLAGESASATSPGSSARTAEVEFLNIASACADRSSGRNHAEAAPAEAPKPAGPSFAGGGRLWLPSQPGQAPEALFLSLCTTAPR